MVKKGYKQTEIGMIPEDWECALLMDKAKLLNGLTYTPDNVKDNGLLVLRSSNIQNNQLSFEDTLYVDCIVEDEKKIKDGDILICVRNGSAALIGKCAQAHRDYEATFGAFMAVLRGNHNDYIHQILQQGTIQKEISKNSGATINQITNGDFKLIRIAMPTSNDEEIAIASSLSHVDRLIYSLEKLISKKKAIKQGAMQELLTGKRRLPGFDGKWQSFVFGDLFDFIPNNAFTRAQMDVSGRVKNIHYGDILTKYGAYISADSKDIPYIAKEIDLSRFSEKCYLQSGDLVIADTAEDETVGKALEVINVECPVLAGQHTLLCRPKVRFAEKFLGYYLNASCYHDQLLPYIVGTKVSSVSKASIAQTKLVVPKYEEQQEISSILSDMDNDITALEEKLAKYRQVKQGMMQQLLTGKIRLTKDIEDSVQAEQVTSEKAMTLRPVHNHQFDDAVAIAAIVDAFYSDKYPLGRVKVQKLLYLLHRYQGVSVSDFKKKAAGPYADTVRYKGGEPIAKKNKYIVSESGKQGTRYSKGKNMGQALDYVERWGMQADLQWLKENFLRTSRNDLELFATVDMAMCDLDEVGISVSVESIKNLIASNKEWKAKLSKTYFSDWDIARAIKKCTELFN